jgi:hypothetical protein
MFPRRPVSENLRGRKIQPFDRVAMTARASCMTGIGRIENRKPSVVTVSRIATREGTN